MDLCFCVKEMHFLFVQVNRHLFSNLCTNVDRCRNTQGNSLKVCIKQDLTSQMFITGQGAADKVHVLADRSKMNISWTNSKDTVLLFVG